MVKEYYVAKCKYCGNKIYFSMGHDIKRLHQKVVCKNCGKENIILINEAKLIRDPKKIEEIIRGEKGTEPIETMESRKEWKEEVGEETPSIKLDLRIRTIKPTVAAILLAGVFMINSMMIIFALVEPEIVNVREFWPFSKDFMKEKIYIEYDKEKIEAAFNTSITEGYWGFNKIEIFGKEEKIFIFPFLKPKIHIRIDRMPGIIFFQSKITSIENDKGVIPKIDKNSFFMIDFNNLKISNLSKALGDIISIKLELEKPENEVNATITMRLHENEITSNISLNVSLQEKIDLSKEKWKVGNETFGWASLLKKFENYSIDYFKLSVLKNISENIYLKKIEILYKSSPLIFSPDKQPFGQIVIIHSFSYELALFLLIFFSILILISSAFAVKRKRYGFIIIGCILGILSVGFLVGAIISIIALALIIISKDEF